MIIKEKPLETYIWGAGENGKALLHNINKYCNISAFVDKNSALHGQCVNGIDVISPDSFVFKENRIVSIAILVYENGKKIADKYILVNP